VSNNALGPPTYTIRGVGYNDFSLSASPDVTVYLDEVPYAYTPMTKGAPFDLQRVEVLKGPQGTLFGQNSTGGAVNYIATKPTESFEAGVETTIARFNATDVNGFVSGALYQSLLARFAFDVTEGGAWQRSDTQPEATLGNKDLKKGRFIVNWTPTDKLTMALNLNGFTDNSDVQAGQLVKVVLASPADAHLGPFPGILAQPIVLDDARAADWDAGTRPANDDTFYQGSLRADYRVSETMSITYIGAYSHYKQNELLEPAGFNGIFDLNFRGDVDSTSQEIRASGKALDQKLDWMAGADYARNLANEFQHDELSDETVAYSFVPFHLLPYNYGNNISRDLSTSTAGFGNLNYHVLDTFNVTGGARFTQTNIHHSGCSEGDIPSDIDVGAITHTSIAPQGCTMITSAFVPSVFNQTLNQSNVSWRLGADWSPLDDTLLYANVSRGYKAGGFPTLSALFDRQWDPVVQESVLAYEGGVKSRFLQNRVELTAAVFYYDYTNKQVEGRTAVPIVGFLSSLVNIPKSAITGSEFGIKVKPLRDLVLSASVTYLDSVVTGNYIGSNPYVSTPLNLKGESLPNTPKWAARAGANYTISLGGKYSAYLGADALFEGHSDAFLGNASAVAEGFPSLEIKSYSLLNLRIGLDTDDGHWHSELSGNNVTNRYYWTNVAVNADEVTRWAGLPITYGFTLAYRY
jgi:outer membrane receptor protein involved in Fe transport